MFGYRERFLYFQCSQCGCLQISEIPSDIAKYYPSTYYSYTQSAFEQPNNSVKKAVKKFRDHYAIFGKGVVGKFLYMAYPNEPLRSLSGVTGLKKQTRILDVGCGSGTLLYVLQDNGFENLLGIDLFFESESACSNRLRILRKSIFDLAGEWDLIMFHHVFEHIPDSLDVLRTVARLLAPNGVCLIRTPTVSSYAWEHYGVNWVQLDAPRHFFIYSVESMKILANNANLSVGKILYDSTDFQFWGSEQYLRDIPLMSERSYLVDRSHSIFSVADIATFKKTAKALNAESQGDSIAIYLRKI